MKSFTKDKQKFEQFVKGVNRVLTWLTSAIIWQNIPSNTSAKPYFSKLARIASSRGLLAMLSYHKLVRLAALRALSGSPVRLEGVGANSSGYPRALGPLLGYLRRQEHLKWVLTILYSTRGLSVSKEADLSPITSPRIGDKLYKDGIDRFWHSLGLYKPLTLESRKLRFKKFHLSTKAGPNGSALWHSVTDLVSLPETLLKSIKVLGGPLLTEKMEVILRNISWLKKYPSVVPFPLIPGRYRKISSIQDKEDKTRVIAILDYWSQAALKPLHQDLFSILRRIPQDCTFDQGSFQSKLREPNGNYYSFDLSSATDRFPIEQITEVLKGRYPLEYLEAWKDVMVGYPFEYKGQYLTYSVGNPMGAYSSWASFALAHHYIVFLACKMAGKSWRKANYVMLGDDIVIGDDQIANNYKSLIEGLGVGVSDTKTHVSPHTYEFAKRWVHKGEEISPFPVSAVLKEKNRYTGLLSVLDTIRFKNWNFKESIPKVIGMFYGIFYERRSRLRARLIDRSIVALAVTQMIKGRSDAKATITTLLQVIGFPLKETQWEGAKAHFHKSVRHSFEKSMSNISKVKNPLGDIATRLVMLITDPDLNPNLDIDLIYAIPLLQVNGLIEEQYIELLKQLKGLDENPHLDWPLVLKALVIPISDDVFVGEDKKIPYQAGSIIGRYLVNSYTALYQKFGILPDDLVE